MTEQLDNPNRVNVVCVKTDAQRSNCISLKKLSVLGAKRSTFDKAASKSFLLKMLRTTTHVKTGNFLNAGSKFHFLEVTSLSYCSTRREKEQTTVKIEWRKENSFSPASIRCDRLGYPSET